MKFSKEEVNVSISDVLVYVTYSLWDIQCDTD